MHANIIRLAIDREQHDHFSVQKGIQPKPDLDAARELRTWSVWRQDDSGNRFLIEANLTEAEAKSMVVDLEARGHKQMYWASNERG